MATKLLVTNAELVVWPGERLAYFLANDLGNGLVALEPAVLEVLIAFATPTNPKTFFRKKYDHVKSAIECLEREGLLVREAQDQCDGWSGLRFVDHVLAADFAAIRPVRSHQIRGRGIYVFEDVLSPVESRTISKWFCRASFRRVDVDQITSSGSKHWLLQFGSPVETIAAVPIFSRLHNIVRDTFSDVRLSIFEVKAYTTPYGDLPIRHRDNDHAATITAVLFCNDRWEDDWAGELLVYDDVDPIYAIQPKPGRAVVFRGDLWHRAGSPSQSAEVPRYSLVIRYDVK